MGTEEVEKVQQHAQHDDDKKKQRTVAALCMALLTIQYGMQPLISKRFTGKYVIMTSAVLTCEMVKVHGRCHLLEGCYLPASVVCGCPFFHGSGWHLVEIAERVEFC